VVSDLQSDIVIGEKTISGTLNYLDDYTGFSGDPAEQVGNFIALHVTSDDGATITAQTVGKDRVVTLDADGLIIVHVWTIGQEIKFTATKGGVSTSKTYGFRGCTLEPASN